MRCCSWTEETGNRFFLFTYFTHYKMSDTTYEVELKVLLWNTFPPDTFVRALTKDFISIKETTEVKHRNHYFEIPHRAQVIPAFEERLPIDHEQKIQIAEFRDWTNIVIRTREITKGESKEVLLVMKSTVWLWTSQNGAVRKELEVKVPMPIEDLDAILVAQAEIVPQAKWSRIRRTFDIVDKDWFYFTVCLDKNAGYGYLAEFEVVVNNPKVIDSVKNKLHECIKLMWLDELPEDRLHRMFEFYNKNWQVFYETENYFSIK